MRQHFELDINLSQASLQTANRNGDCTVPKTILFVRHGESINNILSQSTKSKVLSGDFIAASKGLMRYKRQREWLKKKGYSVVRDSPLSSRGVAEMKKLRKKLFKDGDHFRDKFNIFSSFEKVFVSPLRRTQASAYMIFGDAARKTGVPFEAQPWAHEQRKSQSDTGEKASVLSEFARGLGKYKDKRVEPLKSLLKSLNSLHENWATNWTQPSKLLPYYPHDYYDADSGTTTTPERDYFFQRRLMKLKQELCRDPASRIILVTHSAVIRHCLARLFKGKNKPANGGMFVGVLKRNHGVNVFTQPMTASTFFRRTLKLQSSPRLPAFESSSKRLKEPQAFTGPVKPLEVKIISASGLRNADFGINFQSSGGFYDVSDPYVIVKVGVDSEVSGRTTTIQNDLNPIWNETLYLNNYVPGRKLVFKVYDEDLWKFDDKLGEAQLSSDIFMPDGTGEKPLSLPLVDKEGTNATLKIQIRILRKQIELTNFQKQEIREAFDLFDEDHSGSIDSTELELALGILGIDVQEGAMVKVVSELDSDGSGEIEYDEFLEWMTNKILKPETGGMVETPNRASVQTAWRGSLQAHDGDCSVPKTILFVRHGESINNIISQSAKSKVLSGDLISASKALMRYQRQREWLKKKGYSVVRDSPLSTRGVTSMKSLSKQLFKDGDHFRDKFNIFSSFEKVFVSPLRRTQASAYITFGDAARKAGVPFEVQPWAHELRKTHSDTGEKASVLTEFARRLGKHKDKRAEPLKSLLESLHSLHENWATNWTQPNSLLSYYPPDSHDADASSTATPESAAYLKKRLTKLKQELCRDPAQGIILVTHSAVIRHLLPRLFVGKKKPANGGMFVGILKRSHGMPVLMQPMTASVFFRKRLKLRASPELPDFGKISLKSKTKPQALLGPITPLEITIVSASGLRNADFGVNVLSTGGFFDVSDPYVIVQAEGNSEVSGRTTTIQNDLNPIWNETLYLREYVAGSRLVFKVYDEDLWKYDDKLGEVYLSSDKFMQDGSANQPLELPLIDKEGSNASLKIQIRVVPGQAKLSRFQRQEIRQAFDLFDEDNSGAIDSKELELALGVLGIDMKKGTLEKLVSDLDSDGNGEIEYDEFLTFMTNRILKPNVDGRTDRILKPNTDSMTTRRRSASYTRNRKPRNRALAKSYSPSNKVKRAKKTNSLGKPRLVTRNP